MAGTMFCALDEPTVVSGGTLSGRVVIVLDEDRRAVSEEIPNVYFRLVGTETVRVFKTGIGLHSASRVFIDTVFTLEETFSQCVELDSAAVLARFKFSLPRNLPSSISLANLHSEPYPSKTIWFDATSGVHYTLFASMEPVSHNLIRKLERSNKASQSKVDNDPLSAYGSSASESVSALASASASASISVPGSGSMDMYTRIPLDALQENESLPSEATLRFHLDSLLDEAIIHRGPLVGSATKKVPGATFFSESKPVSLAVNIDQYVIVLGTAFPLLVSINNSSEKSVSSIETSLVATLSLTDGEASSLSSSSSSPSSVEYVACRGPVLDLVVGPGSQVEDKMVWIKLPEDIKIPSSHSATLFKLTYDFLTTALLSDGSSLEVRIPVFVSRGVQLRSHARNDKIEPIANTGGGTKQTEGIQPS